MSPNRRRAIIRWTRGFALVLIINAGLTTILAFILWPPIRQIDRQAIASLGYSLTREGSLVLAAFLLVSGVALWQLQRWGLIVLAAAALLFSLPIVLFDLSFVDLNDLQSFESIFVAFGPTCIPYILLAHIIYAFWRGLGKLRE